MKSLWNFVILPTQSVPGAKNVDAFWKNLQAGVKSIRHFSDQELLAAGVSPEILKMPNYVKAGTILEGAEDFDADFFGYTPREAELTDPRVYRLRLALLFGLQLSADEVAGLGLF